VSLHVEASGTGEPVVLLHSHGLAGGQWRKLAGELPAHRVLAVDLSGQGKSEPWPEPTPFAFTVDVERVVDLVRDVGPAHVVGHSYGGLVALHAARATRVRSLALFDPVAFGVLDPDADRDARAILDALDLSWDDRERWLRTFVEFWSGAGSWAALRPAASDEFRRVAWVIHEGVRTLMADRTPLAAFAALDVPALVMTGERSPLPAQRVVQRLAEAMHARHVVVPDVGHLGPVTHARDVNPHIVRSIEAR